MEYLTVKEVAQLLRIHVRTVDRLLKSGQLKGIQLGKEPGRHWRISKSELDGFLRRNANY